MRYFIDNNGTLYSGGDDAEFADNLKELTLEEFDQVKIDNDSKTEEYSKQSYIEYIKSIRERYDRLVRNGWNEADARIESGLDQIEGVK